MKITLRNPKSWTESSQSWDGSFSWSGSWESCNMWVGSYESGGIWSGSWEEYRIWPVSYGNDISKYDIME